MRHKLNQLLESLFIATFVHTTLVYSLHTMYNTGKGLFIIQFINFFFFFDIVIHTLYF